MSRVRKRVCLALVVVLMMFSVAAQDSVFIGDGDIGGIRLFDSQGVRLDTTAEVTSNIGQGWIIHNPDTPILIVTPKGFINLYEDSIIITGDLISYNPSLYLVKGKATFSTHSMESGTLSVSTPVSLFKLTGDGEMFIITNDVEESATVFKGEVTSYNSITHATRTIRTFQKLFMHESPAKTKPIASGYYLTYATYPDLMLAKQLISEMATEKRETPSLPKFSHVLQAPQKVEPPVMQQGVTIMPSAAPSFVSVNVVDSTHPPVPYSISVRSEPVKVPSIPQTLTSTIVPQPKTRIIVTVSPMVPVFEEPIPVMEAELVAKPATPLVISTVEPLDEKVAEPEEAATEEPMAIEPEEAATEEPMAIEPEEVATEEPMAIEPEVTPTVIEPETAEPEVLETVAREEATPKQEKPKGVLFTQEEDLKEGSVGLEASYSFLIDGTDNNSLHHTLGLKPFVTYKSFALTLQSSVSTTDFALFTSNVTPVPTGTLEMLSYGFKFISDLRFGYSSSPFFLALDSNQYHSTLTDHLFAPRFGDSSKLGLYNRIEIGSFSSTLYFDDLYLTDLLATTAKHQFSSFSLAYAKQEGYHFSVSLGTLAKIQRLPSWNVELYPNVNFFFPLIDVRTTQLGLLVSASGYLSAYPTFKFEEFIDLNLTTFFPNYQVSAGLSLKQGSFSAKLLGSLRKGEHNRNLLTSDLAYAIPTSYTSIFDIFAETGFSGDHFNARLTVNLPFASDFTLASVTGSSHKADFSQLTLSYKQKSFTFSFGLQEVGIVETISSIIDGSKEFTTLFGGERATSFLSAAYTTGVLTIKAKAAYPANVTAYSTPQITIMASLKLGMQF